MNFVIDDKIFSKYEEVILGVLIVRNLDNSGSDAGVCDLLRSQERVIKETYDPETLSKEPAINAWREVYRSFGVKPADARSSVENLYRMVLRGAEIRSINKLVDLYNYISLKYMVPVGGEDIDAMSGDLCLTIAADEMPVKLLGDAKPEAPADGEVIYRDDDSAICRRWNWREAERTKLTEQTTSAILVIEGIAPVNREVIASATDELAMLIGRYCGGDINKHMMNRNNSAIDM